MAIAGQAEANVWHQLKRWAEKSWHEMEFLAYSKTNCMICMMCTWMIELLKIAKTAENKMRQRDLFNICIWWFSPVRKTWSCIEAKSVPVQGTEIYFYRHMSSWNENWHPHERSCMWSRTRLTAFSSRSHKWLRDHLRPIQDYVVLVMHRVHWSLLPRIFIPMSNKSIFS